MALTNVAMEWYDDDPLVDDWVKITDHNRSPIDVSVERIETKDRMANGTLRRYVVAKKRSWSTSWERLPSKNGLPGFEDTVDGGIAGEDIEAFHNDKDGSFALRIVGADGVVVATATVMISDFDKAVVKRSSGGMEFWDLSITLEEV